MTDRSADAARLLFEADRTNTPIDNLPETYRPRSFEDAYAIQDAMCALRGAPPGWKVAKGDPTDFCPAFSVISGGAAIAAGDRPGLAVEIEFGFTVLRDLPPRAAAYSADEVFAALAFTPLLEVIASRYRDKKARSRIELLADSISNVALVVGEPMRDWRGIDFRGLKVDLVIDDRERLTSTGTHKLDNPALLAIDLAAHAAQRGGLRAGQAITTGALKPSTPIKAGERLVGIFGPWGRVETHIT